MNEWLTTILEEYKSIRTESNNAIQLQQHIVYIALGSIGLVSGFGFTLWDKCIVPEFIFNVFIPVLSYVFLFNWLGEVARMMRAGNYIFELEDRVNEALKDDVERFGNVLNWEHWIRESVKQSTRQHKWNYIVVMALFIGFPVLSSILGIYHFYAFSGINNVIITIFVLNTIIWTCVVNITFSIAMKFH
jgi:nitrate reductase NapE component